MANYLLAYSGTTPPESEEGMANVMEAWGAWFGALGPAIVDGGAPTGEARTIKGDSVSPGGGVHPLSGYSVISADSIDTAVTLAKGCPVLADGGTVNVYEAVAIEM
ncbi:MAG: hypothetical protein GXP36_14245 [Actinobacteria bacterium]|nr:hypothetical protein [Actinomycetota bacterium]